MRPSLPRIIVRWAILVLAPSASFNMPAVGQPWTSPPRR